MTVHPLGGCPMAETAGTRASSTTAAACSRARPATAVHDGLYVMDASVIPRALGVNPLLTITGLAERACALLATGSRLDDPLRRRRDRCARARGAGRVDRVHRADGRVDRARRRCRRRSRTRT